MADMRNISRSPVTIALIAANVAMFAWLWLHGADPMNPSGEDLARYGSDSGVFVANGEWWRLVTSMFLHGGAIHLAVNMWSLWALGPTVEAMYGRAAMFVVYMLAGLAGSIASCLWHPLGTSVGASGAIFGLLGAIIAFFVAHRRSMPPGEFSSVMKRIGVVLAINLYLGFSIARVDNSAHLGGLLAGFVSGFAAWRAPRTPATLDAKRGMRLAVIGVVLVGAAFLIPWRVRVEWDAYQRSGGSEELRPR